VLSTLAIRAGAPQRSSPSVRQSSRRALHDEVRTSAAFGSGIGDDPPARSMRVDGSRILYASTNHGWDVGWTFYQMLAGALARVADVVYVDSPRSLARLQRRDLALLTGPHAHREDGVRVLRTVGVPAQRTEWLRRAAARLTAAQVGRWARSERFEPDLFWTYSPYELALLDRFPHVRSVYWTGDEVVMPGEAEVLRRVDAILCVSTPVYERQRARYGGRVHFVPVACDFDRYHAALGYGAAELADLRRPIVGYSGFVNDRVDTALVADVARSLGTAGTVAVVGPVAEAQRRELASTPNVVLVGPQPPERVPRLIDAFDVAVIPYTDSEFNHNSNPAKFYEYLALGKPVVSTDIPTLRPFGDVASIGSRESFVDRTRAVLEQSGDNAQARIAIARDHSFDALLDRLRALPE